VKPGTLLWAELRIGHELGKTLEEVRLLSTSELHAWSLYLQKIGKL
jgi:hypothetical protein